MDDIKTYDVKCGTIGILPDGTKKLFPTEEEAVEYIREVLNSKEEDVDK